MKDSIEALFATLEKYDAGHLTLATYANEGDEKPNRLVIVARGESAADIHEMVKDYPPDECEHCGASAGEPCIEDHVDLEDA